MVFKLENYALGYRLASLATCHKTIAELLSDNLNVLFLSHDSLMLLPDDITLSRSPEVLAKIARCVDYDVFEIDPTGRVQLRYSNQSADNSFFITGKCNSNCIMCPSSEQSRKYGSTSDLSALLQLARYIPSDAPHLTVTGGEPFMLGTDIFCFFEALREKFKNTNFLVLTNGRVFAVEEYCRKLRDNVPEYSILGIPIHGYNADTHDYITRVPGSFAQTVTGIKNLLALGIHIELRIVISRISAVYLEEIAKLILRVFPGVCCVRLIGLEMLGNAARNADKVWITYSDAFKKAEAAIQMLVRGGIDVGLYNFPLCAVDKAYWSICAKSITDYKIRFAERCADCYVKDACGGLFAGTYRLAKEDIQPL